MHKLIYILLLAGALLFAAPPASAEPVWTSAQWLPEEKTLFLLKEVWDVQTFEELKAGQVIVTDPIMNELLAEEIAENPKIEKVTFASQANGQIKLEIITPAYGRVKIVGVLEEVHHDVNSSSLTFRVLNKQLLDKPLVSWIFSRVSLAMLSKIYGNPAAGTDLSVTIRGNMITADFHEYLYTTRIGQVNLFGCRLLDEIQLTGAQCKDGYVILETNFHLTPEMEAVIPNFLQRS